MNDEARRLFEELGSTAIKELAFRDSWVFVGAKGIENKSPFEQVDDYWCFICQYVFICIIHNTHYLQHSHRGVFT